MTNAAFTTLWASALLCVSAYAQNPTENGCAGTETPSSMSAKQTGRYAAVNGLKMYYEIHGSGQPLVLIHGGGSTIESTFGRILPDLARTHQVIAVELQAHGHTLDIDRPLSFEQDAADVAALLRQLHIDAGLEQQDTGPRYSRDRGDPWELIGSKGAAQSISLYRTSPGMQYLAQWLRTRPSAPARFTPP